jgi:hypothetical protein
MDKSITQVGGYRIRVKPDPNINISHSPTKGVLSLTYPQRSLLLISSYRKCDVRPHEKNVQSQERNH